MLSLWVILQHLGISKSPPGNIHKTKKRIPIKFSLCYIMQLSVADSVTSGSVEVQLL